MRLRIGEFLHFGQRVRRSENKIPHAVCCVGHADKGAADFSVPSMVGAKHIVNNFAGVGVVEFEFDNAPFFEDLKADDGAILPLDGPSFLEKAAKVGKGEGDKFPVHGLSRFGSVRVGSPLLPLTGKV